MTKRVRVRRLNDEEGRQLQQIVRRGGKSDRSIVKWRRAMVVLASAGGNDVAAIARLVQTSPDRVREMIHRFNDLGMRSLDPQWAGGRPRQITTADRALIVKTAKTRPTKLGRRSRTGRSASSPTTSPAKKGRKVVIGRERLRQILIAEGITFQRTKTWKESPDPLKEAKLARIEWLLEHARDRTFAFDEFGPLTIKPVGGAAWAPRGQPGAVAGELSQAARVEAVLRLVLDRRRPARREPSSRARDRRRRCGRCKRSGPASTTANRST